MGGRPARARPGRQRPQLHNRKIGVQLRARNLPRGAHAQHRGALTPGAQVLGERDRYTGTRDIIVGTPMLGRLDDSLNNVVFISLIS